jgi:hypothetical protein
MTQTLLVEIHEHGADPARLDQLSRHLLKDLRRLGLRTERQPVRAPAGTKSGSAVAVASLLVGLAGTPALKAFVTGIFDWLGPRRGSVKISCGDRSVELSTATPAERRELFEWLQTCDEETRNPDRNSRDD